MEPTDLLIKGVAESLQAGDKGISDLSDLSMVLRFELDWRLEHITSSTDLPSAISDVIRYADARGQIDELVAAFLRRSPTNEKLKELYQTVSTQKKCRSAFNTTFAARTDV
jgi:Effector-associated domain 1